LLGHEDSFSRQAFVGLLALLVNRHSLCNLEQNGLQLLLGEGQFEQGAFIDLISQRPPGVLPQRKDPIKLGAQPFLLEILQPFDSPIPYFQAA
jgi:hypothetical protein